MAIDVRPPDDLRPPSARPRLTLVQPLAWAVAVLVSSAMWAGLAYGVYSLLTA